VYGSFSGARPLRTDGDGRHGAARRKLPGLTPNPILVNRMVRVMVICLPPRVPPPPQHSSRHGPQHTQHTASTAATPRYPQGRRQYPCRRAGPTQTAYARPFRRAQTQGQRKGGVRAYLGCYYICPLLSIDAICDWCDCKLMTAGWPPDAPVSVFRHSFLVLWTHTLWVPGKVPRWQLAFTRYCHYQYWLLYGIHKGGCIAQ